jgi:glycolate oxidase iron-sulfur subunit
MRTDFTLAQLADPDVAAADKILRACVHCGFCTATCPTYVLTGDERDGPRGRIWLIKDMLEAEGRAPEGAPPPPPDPAVVRHVDRCLSCLSCMSTCPSGVDYGHLVDIARRRIGDRHRRPANERLVRGLLQAVLPRPNLMRLALAAGRLARPLARRLPGTLGALGRMVPSRLPDRADHVAPGVHPAQGTRRMRVALIPGCVQQVLGAGTNAAIVRLLTRLGAEIVVPPGAVCCGALPQHMGADAKARALAAPTLDALDRAGPLDAVLVAASGCGATLKDWDHLFAADPVRADAATRMAALARDVTEIVATLGLGAVTPRPLAVAYHDSCSLRHGQKITSLPRALLAEAGFEVREPAEGHLCCGSAGTYNMLQPDFASALQARKAANLKATGATLVAAGNLGCITQIAAGVDMPVVHTAELLDWATGGPPPEALRHVRGELGPAPGRA